MGQTPDDIQRQMSSTRSNIESTVDSLKTSTAATVKDASTAVASTVDDLGTRASDAASSVAAKIPKLENATPLLIASTIVGLVAGFIAPITAFERTRLQPVGDELATRIKNARVEIVGQSKAVVDETVSAAKKSVNKHGRETAEHLGV